MKKIAYIGLLLFTLGLFLTDIVDGVVTTCPVFCINSLNIGVFFKQKEDYSFANKLFFFLNLFCFYVNTLLVTFGVTKQDNTWPR